MAKWQRFIMNVRSKTCRQSIKLGYQHNNSMFIYIYSYYLLDFFYIPSQTFQIAGHLLVLYHKISSTSQITEKKITYSLYMKFYRKFI